MRNPNNPTPVSYEDAHPNLVSNLEAVYGPVEKQEAESTHDDVPSQDELLQGFTDKRQKYEDELAQLESVPGFKRVYEDKAEIAGVKDDIQALNEEWNSYGGDAVDAAQSKVDALDFRSTADDHIHAKAELRAAKDAFYAKFTEEYEASRSQTAEQGAANQPNTPSETPSESKIDTPAAEADEPAATPEAAESTPAESSDQSGDTPDPVEPAPAAEGDQGSDNNEQDDPRQNIVDAFKAQELDRLKDVDLGAGQDAVAIVDAAPEAANGTPKEDEEAMKRGQFAARAELIDATPGLREAAELENEAFNHVHGITSENPFKPGMIGEQVAEAKANRPGVDETQIRAEWALDQSEYIQERTPDTPEVPAAQPTPEQVQNALDEAEKEKAKATADDDNKEKNDEEVPPRPDYSAIDSAREDVKAQAAGAAGGSARNSRRGGPFKRFSAWRQRRAERKEARKLLVDEVRGEGYTNAGIDERMVKEHLEATGHPDTRMNRFRYVVGFNTKPGKNANRRPTAGEARDQKADESSADSEA